MRRGKKIGMIIDKMKSYRTEKIQKDVYYKKFADVKHRRESKYWEQ